jgi:thiosulfate dehydrogenase [quinone] large subunit
MEAFMASTSSVVTPRGVVTIADPPVVFSLFSTTRFAWLWLILRLYAGIEWARHGIEKLMNPAWWSGESLASFWSRAIEVPAEGRPAISYEWYRNFIQHMLEAEWYIWFSKIIMFGETLIGIALILGAFVGIAAFLGGFLNWNFIMAGSASTNGVLFTIAVILIAAWMVAGWYGLDRYLLPLLGTPWQHHPPKV